MNEQEGRKSRKKEVNQEEGQEEKREGRNKCSLREEGRERKEGGKEVEEKPSGLPVSKERRKGRGFYLIHASFFGIVFG